jgi:hypothetical protein
MIKESIKNFLFLFTKTEKYVIIYMMRKDIRNNKWYGGKSMRAKVCCICGCNLEGYGNNPEGAMWRDPQTNEIVEFEPEAEDRCCDDCNSRYVIPGRLYKFNRRGN